MVIVENMQYEIAEEFRDGFNEEALNERFSEVLLKYDFILGDWGYGQLRLKGFFDDRNPKSTYETKISTVQDYIYEYCNFGCAYFILKKIGKVKAELTEVEAVEEVHSETTSTSKIE
ncbi:YutD family protein [Sporosarcina sp. P34]|uniref:YutD family protein n=1 Tax=Sporosarcina sp. P34 TaxID=2048247 RepID=UPI001E3838DF|nr:YutD family protein [Sporosarcina sp. P34]